MASGGDINTDKLSDETFDLLCTMCKNQGKNTEAEKFCVDCHDYYCLTCLKVHSQVPLLMRHKVLDKSRYQPGTIHGLPMAPTERCNRHNHKHIDMYCRNHDDVGCSTCMAVEHRLCTDIFYIPEFIQNNPNAVAPTDFQLQLEAVALALTEQTDSFQQEKQCLFKKKSELLEKIKMFRKEINYRLDELEKSSVDEIENKFKAMVDQIEEEIKQLQTIKANVSSVKEKLSSAHTNISEVFVNVKTGENFVNNATNCIEANKMRIQLGDIEFTANSEILPLLQKIDTLGEFTEINAAVEHNPAAKTQQKNPLLQIKNKKTYCLRAQSDRNTCDVVSICALEDGTITLADYNNLKLKRLNSSTFEVINYFNLPGVPWQLCTIDGQNVAVSVPTKQEVFFISVGNYMTTRHKIKTDFDCFGLAYANSNLFITDESSSVYMYNTSGKKLKKVNKEQPGQGLFSDIRSLVVSKDASKIYVADFDKGLVVLSNNGQVVGVYNDQQLQGAFDCYLTETENVLVCGHNSKNILQFGPDGNLIGEVLKFSGEYKGPRSSCCIQQMTKMIIGMLRDSVEVFAIVAE